MRVGDLEGLALADAEVLVAARVRRTVEADLVPGVRVAVEGGARVARPQAPDLAAVGMLS